MKLQRASNEGQDGQIGKNPVFAKEHAGLALALIHKISGRSTTKTPGGSLVLGRGQMPLFPLR